MKRLLLFLVISPLHCLDLQDVHYGLTIITQQVKQIDELIQEEKKEAQTQTSPVTPQTPHSNRCPSGSSTKVKVALISASASIITAGIYLIIHFTK